MKDLEQLASIYRDAHDRVLDLNLDARQIALLAVYDEGWSDGHARGATEAIEYIAKHQADLTHWTGAVEAAREHFA
jgi:hypothetical protein